MSKTILIVDDHPIVLYGLKFLFEGDPGFIIGGEASEVGQARELAESLKPDFIILDLMLGGNDGLELIRDLLAVSPASRILVYSSQSERLFGRRCAAAGAWGYVSKSEGLPMVAKALSMVAAGQRRFGGLAVEIPMPMAIDQLSARELQVLRMIGERRTTRQISETLTLSVKTVGTYRDRIKTKLGLGTVRDLDDLARDYVAGRLG